MEKIILNKKYKNLLKYNSRYYILTGGRASGKSFAVSSFLLLLTFERGHKILFTRWTMTSAHISIIPEFIEKIERLELSDYFEITKNEIINKATGSSILFRGIKTSSGVQTANLKSISGITTWVLDEAEELVSEDIFNKIDLSIRTMNKKNRIIVVLNPTTKESFFYKRFFLERGVEAGYTGLLGGITYIHSTYLDNLDYLSESIVEQIEWIRSNDIKKFNHIVMGGWLEKAEGVIFDNWRVGEFKENDDMIWGSDFGFSFDPSTCIQVSFEKKSNTIWVREVFWKKGMITDNFISEYKKLKNPVIIADSAEPRLIDEIARAGVNIKAVRKGAGSVKEGIMFMKDLNIIIDKDSENLIKEFNNYCWRDGASEQPIDKWNHGIDAIRYVVSWRRQFSSMSVPFMVK